MYLFIFCLFPYPRKQTLKPESYGFLNIKIPEFVLELQRDLLHKVLILFQNLLAFPPCHPHVQLLTEMFNGVSLQILEAGIP